MRSAGHAMDPASDPLVSPRVSPAALAFNTSGVPRRGTPLEGRAQAHYTRDLEDAAGGANRELLGVAEELVAPVADEGPVLRLIRLEVVVILDHEAVL